LSTSYVLFSAISSDIELKDLEELGGKSDASDTVICQTKMVLCWNRFL